MSTDPDQLSESPATTSAAVAHGAAAVIAPAPTAAGRADVASASQSACCAPTEELSCCAQSEKSRCCGPETEAGDRCGCT